MKACIVVGEYYSPGQTFVNRHIDLLCGGNSCVIAGRLNDKRPVEEGRFFARRSNSMTLADKVIAPFVLPWNQWQKGTIRVPFGSAKTRLVSFLQDHKPDFVLSEFGTQGVVTTPITHAMGIPSFCYFRGSDASSRLQHKHVRRAYKLMMGQLDGVFSVSQFLLDNLASKGVHHPNAVVIPSGVNVRWFTPEEKRPHSFMAVGRFVEKKAPQTTLRSFAEATAHLPDAHLTMVGNGELLEACRALAAELGVAEKVTFPGSLPHEKVRDIMVRTEVFLQHSLTARNGNTEGLPTAIQEALACGCIVVSTRHAGIPEAVDHGETGFMVEEGDATGFTNSIKEVLAMPSEARHEMGLRARQVAETRFDNDMLLEKLEASISETVARRKASGR